MLTRMIEVRNLVAVELTYLGPRIILSEYALAVLVSVVVGVLSLRMGAFRAHSIWQVLLGIYLLFLALTYAVLLAYAIAMTRRGDFRRQIAGELNGTAALFRKYRKQSLWILVPLAVPISAIRQR